MADEWWTTFFDRAYTESWADAGMFDGTAEAVRQILALVDGARSVRPGTTGGDRTLRILDVPCGFGRHAGLLHADGHAVTGVDLSADQLALAAERNPGPAYVQPDMRTPPAGPFDVVVNLFSSIGYFQDSTQDLVALKAWHDVLVPGGVLIIETNHRDRIAKIVEPDVAIPIGDTGGVEFGHMDWVTGRMHRTVRYADGTERHFRVRMYTATELVAMAHESGFVDAEAYGDLAGSPLGPDTRLVIRARRTS